MLQFQTYALVVLLIGLIACEGTVNGSNEEYRDGGASPWSDGGARTGNGGGTSEVSPLGQDEFALYQSGSRLKARTITTADGARAFVGWHDSEEGVDCAFLESSAGLRCLPMPMSVSNYFADASCETELAAVSCTQDTSSGVLSKMIVLGDACTASSIFKPVELVARYEGDIYILSAEGNCLQSVSSDSVHYFQVQSLDPSRYVEGTGRLE